MRGPGGHIRERLGSDGKKRYQVNVEIDGDPATGVRRQISGGTFRTKRQAQEKVSEILNQGPPARSKVSLGEFLTDEWLPSKLDLSPATHNQYEWAMSHIVGKVGAVKLSALTARHVQQLHDGLRAEGLSSRSRQIVGKALRNALSMAVKRGYLDRSPADGVPIANGQRAEEIMFWSVGEARDFLNCDAVLGDWMRPLWQTALATGLRRGELCALRWQDIDLDARRLTVRQAARLSGYTASVGPPKTRAAIRTVGLDDGTVDVLRVWKAEQKKILDRMDAKPTFVFAEQDGNMMHPQTMALRFTAITKKAAVRTIGLHGLRHTHATMALEAGVPLKGTVRNFV